MGLPKQWEVPNDLRNFALLTLCGGWISMNIHEYPSVIPQFVGQDHHFSRQTRVFLLVLPHPGRWCARDEPCKFEGWAQGEAREERKQGKQTKTPEKYHRSGFICFILYGTQLHINHVNHIIHLVCDIPFKLQLSSIFGFIPVANSSFVAYALSTVPRWTDDIDIYIYIYIYLVCATFNCCIATVLPSDYRFRFRTSSVVKSIWMTHPGQAGETVPSIGKVVDTS